MEIEAVQGCFRFSSDDEMEGSLWWEGFVEQIGLCWQWKKATRVMEDEIGEWLKGEDIIVTGRDVSETGWQRIVTLIFYTIEILTYLMEWGWRRDTGSWCQRWVKHVESYDELFIKRTMRNRLVRLSRDEERVLPGGWTVLRWCKCEGLLVVRTL